MIIHIQKLDKMAHHYHTIGDKGIGLIIGGSIGFIKGLISVGSFISFQSIMETIILAIIGSIAGFLTTGFLKYLKNKLNG